MCSVYAKQFLSVDAGRAGFGNLEMAIKDSDGVIIPSHVAQLEPGTAKFLVTFNPTSLGMHTVNITFNKEVLKSKNNFSFYPSSVLTLSTTLTVLITCRSSFQAEGANDLFVVLRHDIIKTLIQYVAV